MAAEGGDNKKTEGKGFAGLSSLVSDVDTTEPPPASNTGPAGPTASTARKALPPSQPQPSQRQTDQKLPQPSSGDSSGGKWVLGIAAIIGVLWLIGQADKTTTTSPAPAYTTPAQSTGSNYSPPANAEAPSRPQESKPPVGRDLVLSMAQIRYCLAEDIRMDGAKSVLNNSSDNDVDRFNAMVADYNSRCGSFRYRSGALESARWDVEVYRSQLQSEGRGRFAHPSTGALSESASSRPASSTNVQAIQSKLNELGYSAGTPDGLMGRDTRSAILAFQRNNGLVADGNPTAALLQILTASSQAERKKAPAPAVAVVPPTFTPFERSPSRQQTTNSSSGDIPRNAHLNYFGNDWECNRGYFRYGNECRAVQIPQNGKLTYLGNDWECSRGYFRYGDECRAVQVPENGKLTFLGNDWECNRGYFKYGNECLAVQIPKNGKLTYLGNDWECRRGYFKYESECHEVQVPQNGKLTYLGNDWECNRGFQRVGDKCVLISQY